jgi:sulfane dehydrogenase subunit SoxC
MTSRRRRSQRTVTAALPAPVADRGLLDRRAFLTGAVQVAGLVAVGNRSGDLLATAQAAESPTLETPPWMKIPGQPFRGYGQPAKYEAEVKRVFYQPYKDIAPGAGASMTPLHQLQGTITPNGLHFERHHSGVPDIDPAQHELLIHGLVRRPLQFSVEALLRYPTVSRIYFLECSGNSFFNVAAEPPQKSCGAIHGLISCSEWTGVSLALLLDEAGLDAKGKCMVAEGADAAAMNRSIPLEKALDDALIALYQNGERIRPEQGYPMRLLLPGWEGNTSIKWLRRLTITEGPVYSREETAKYTDLMPDGTARQFTFPMAVKSVITHPSAGMRMQGKGLYEVSGLAWSGAGRVTKVDVSADGGKSWAEAALQAPVLPVSLTRFRIPWAWKGEPVLLQSRATDEQGNVQTTRDKWAEQYSVGNVYHYNAMQTWSISPEGEIKNVYL